MRMGSRRPWEMTEWDIKEAVTAIKHTSKGIVPCSQCSQESTNPTGALHRCQDLTAGVTFQVSNAEEQIVHVQEEEQQEHG